jgi:high-affinity K+ transport system ATPase subunit B
VLTEKPEDLKLIRRHSRRASLVDPELLKPAFWQSLAMLRPDIQWKKPVMFVVEVGTAVDVARLAAQASAADQTPEGKSIVDLFHKLNDAGGASRGGDGEVPVPSGARFVAFSAQTRMSGIDLPDGQRIRKGAPDAILRHVQNQRGAAPVAVEGMVAQVAGKGATPLLVARAIGLRGWWSWKTSSSQGLRSGLPGCAAWACGP